MLRNTDQCRVTVRWITYLVSPIVLSVVCVVIRRVNIIHGAIDTILRGDVNIVMLLLFVLFSEEWIYFMIQLTLFFEAMWTLSCYCCLCCFQKSEFTSWYNWHYSSRHCEHCWCAVSTSLFRITWTKRWIQCQLSLQSKIGSRWSVHLSVISPLLKCYLHKIVCVWVLKDSFRFKFLCYWSRFELIF